MSKKRPFKNFHGTVDELLNHCNEIDVDLVNNDSIILSTDEAIDIIKEEFHCNDEEAKIILQEIKLIEARQIILKLQLEGLVEIKSYDEDGEPKYGLTEKGKEYAIKIKKDNNIP